MRRPAIPSSVEPDLPRGVIGELRKHARDPDDVARALTIAADAIEADDAQRALPYLQWAKSDAPRAPSVREALGIAHYLAGDWGRALTELQAYRRFTGRNDQNHLVADCLRAQGRDVVDVGQVASEIDPQRDGEDRYVEAMIVWASALADAGDPAGGRVVIRRTLEEVTPAAFEGDDLPEHLLRLWYVAGDVAERDGDAADARRWFGRVAAVDREFYDVGERLERLDADPGVNRPA